MLEPPAPAFPRWPGAVQGLTAGHRTLMDHADRTGGGVARGGVWTVLQDGAPVILMVGHDGDNPRGHFPLSFLHFTSSSSSSSSSCCCYFLHFYSPPSAFVDVVVVVVVIVVVVVGDGDCFLCTPSSSPLRLCFDHQLK